ncbi:hypothetical protein KSP40_PGU022662 [Platanthera guangdongensis]|uniref:Uncharacterized protein n=1 Tax=Platanthera guangdongensis TaxID=2320717 RepID=A0ABR2M4E4_9ASPA
MGRCYQAPKQRVAIFPIQAATMRSPGKSNRRRDDVVKIFPDLFWRWWIGLLAARYNCGGGSDSQMRGGALDLRLLTNPPLRSTAEAHEYASPFSPVCARRNSGGGMIFD